MIGPFKHTSQLMRAAVSHEVIGQSLSALRVLGILIDAGGSGGSCRFTDKTIGDELRISRWSIKRAVEALEGAGFVQSNRRKSRRGRATTYLLPLDRPGVIDDATPDSVAPNATLVPNDVARNATLSSPNSVALNATQSSNGVAPREQKRIAGRTNSVAPRRNTYQDLNQKLNQGSRSRPRSAQNSGKGDRKRPPKPPENASIEELVRHAVEHGHAAGVEVIRRMAERMGHDPEAKGGAIGKYLWPVIKREEPPDRLLEAARWADQAIDPNRVPIKAPLDGFLIKASGGEVAWPRRRESEEDEQRKRERHTASSRCLTPQEQRRREHAAIWVRRAAEKAAREAQAAQDSGNSPQDMRQMVQDRPGSHDAVGVGSPPESAPRRVPVPLSVEPCGTGEESDTGNNKIKYSSHQQNSEDILFDDLNINSIFNKDTPETAWAKFEEFRRRRLAATAN